MQKGAITKEKIKDASLNLFHERGYKNTSINDILDSSGVKKGAFYFHYQSKENLIVEVLAKALASYEETVEPPAGYDFTTHQIIEIINKISDFHIDAGTSKGCIFGNMALEVGHNGTDVSEFVETVFRRWEQRFEDLLSQAVERGELKLKESPQTLSRIILSLIEGGLLLSKISGNSDSFKDCISFVTSLIEERKV